MRLFFIGLFAAALLVPSPTAWPSDRPAVSFGHHAKLVASPSERERIERFYQDVLGCVLTKKTDKMDIVRIGDQFLVVIFQGEVPPASELLKSIWLEVATDKPDELKKRILDFGIKEIPHPSDTQHFLFQAPDGQVYRVVARSEDLSRSEK